MKAHLLHRDQDVDLQQPQPWNAGALTADLALNTLFNAMSRGDKLLFEVAQKTILSGMRNDLETIQYRQAILQDCLNNPDVLRELYALACEATEKQKKLYYFTLTHHPIYLLHGSIEFLETLLTTIKRLRKIADSHADKFGSEGWTVFFAMLQRELTDEYFISVKIHLEQLKFRNGVLLSAGLGKGNKGTNYVLHVVPQKHYRRWERLMRLLGGEWLKNLIKEWMVPKWERLTKRFGRRPSVLEFTLHPRDESGARALSELQDRGICLVANAVTQSADHVRSFFTMLRTELAFYVGCVNLHEQLVRKKEPLCFPLPMPAEERRLSFRGLYDVCLALSVDQRVVGNDANADQQDLVIVTGANQGGKSTFLRSVALAQLLMQCGMFVPAESFNSSVYDGLFTHYKREEDTSMKSGKLDEELSRMNDIVDHMTTHPMILFNESFAATNEREGSEIARQILSALLEKRVKIVCVTHLYELAHSIYQGNKGNVLFLRAERQDGGVRTFRLVEGEPLKTSFGEDLYHSIFGVEAVC